MAVRAGDRAGDIASDRAGDTSVIWATNPSFIPSLASDLQHGPTVVPTLVHSIAIGTRNRMCVRTKCASMRLRLWMHRTSDLFR